MRASGQALSAMQAATCVAAALCGLGAGAGWSQEVSPLKIEPRPVCMGPQRPPDRSIPAPRVVSTCPAQGAVVRPGYVVIRLTFNVAMSCDGVFLDMPSRMQPCAENSRQDVIYSFDRRTIQMTCKVARNASYGLRLNYDPSNEASRMNRFAAAHLNFMSVAGAPLKRFELTFSTSSGPEVASQKEALAAEAAASGEQN